MQDAKNKTEASILAEWSSQVFELVRNIREDVHELHAKNRKEYDVINERLREIERKSATMNVKVAAIIAAATLILGFVLREVHINF